MELAENQYKKTEIGLISSEWTVRKLFDIAQIATGSTHNKRHLKLRG